MCFAWTCKRLAVISGYLHYCKSRIFKQPDFYDSMLGDVTDEDRVDYVSSAGYAWGYIGSCVPFIVCLVLVLGSGKIGISMEMSMMIAFLIIAAWWLVMSLPLLKGYEQKFYVESRNTR